MALTHEQADDYVILSGPRRVGQGAVVEVCELTGPDIGLHEQMCRTHREAEERGLGRAAGKGVSLWYDPDPIDGSRHLQLVASFRAA